MAPIERARLGLRDGNGRPAGRTNGHGQGPSFLPSFLPLLGTFCAGFQRTKQKLDPDSFLYDYDDRPTGIVFFAGITEMAARD